MFIEISARNGKIEKYEHDSFEEAEESITTFENYGECFGIGIYNDQSQTLYVKTNSVAGISEDDIFQQKVNSCKERGIIPVSIKIY